MDTSAEATFFLIHIDYLQREKTTNVEYYPNSLDEFNNDLKKKTSTFSKEESDRTPRQYEGA